MSRAQYDKTFGASPHAFDICNILQYAIVAAPAIYGALEFNMVI